MTLLGHQGATDALRLLWIISFMVLFHESNEAFQQSLTLKRTKPEPRCWCDQTRSLKPQEEADWWKNPSKPLRLRGGCVLKAGGGGGCWVSVPYLLSQLSQPVRLQQRQRARGRRQNHA